MTISLFPNPVVEYVTDTAPPLRLLCIDLTTNLRPNLAGATVNFYLRRRGYDVNVFTGSNTLAVVLPDPCILTTRVLPVFNADGSVASVQQVVKVTSTARIAVGNYVSVGFGTDNEEAVLVIALGSDYFTAIFSRPHVMGEIAQIVPLADGAALAAAVSVSGSPQSVRVTTSDLIKVGNLVRIGEGTGTVEDVTVTAVVDTIHLSAVFTKVHSSGDTVQFTPATADPIANGVGGYFEYRWPGGGLVSSGAYVGQAKITFPDATVTHTDYLTLEARQVLS